MNTLLLAGLLTLVMLPATALPQSINLYFNDFETPNVPVAINCGNSLDTRGIEILYGKPGFTFSQLNTVEAVAHADIGDFYNDPEGKGGAYSLGMLSTAEDDKLALTFDTQGRRYVNVGFDLSAIDVNGCGGPFGVAVPVMRVALLDSPGGTFNFGQTELDAKTLTNDISAPEQYTFHWAYGVVALDTTGTTDGKVSIVFDLLESGYAAFDNLSIVASNTEDVVDRDVDGVTDDVDNCPDVANADQADTDGDTIGDACDPTPGSCSGVPVAATFASIDCRLQALLADVAGEPTLGTLAPRLTKAGQTARSRTQDGAAACADGNRKKAGKQVKRLVRALIQFGRHLRSLNARRKLAEPIRSRFLDGADAIQRDARELKSSLSCGG